MPIQVRISVNENVTETFHIGRLTRSGLNEDSINEYAVVNQHQEPTPREWDAAPRFTHRYGDDLNTIVLEAISRHQEEILGTEHTAHIIPVHRSTVEAKNNKRLCMYKSSRMKGPCSLSYGHKEGHRS